MQKINTRKYLIVIQFFENIRVEASFEKTISDWFIASSEFLSNGSFVTPTTT